MLGAQAGRLGVLLAAGEFALTTLSPVGYTDAALNDAVLAADDGAETFAGAWWLDRGWGWECCWVLLGKIHRWGRGCDG